MVARGGDHVGKRKEHVFTEETSRCWESEAGGWDAKGTLAVHTAALRLLLPCQPAITPHSCGLFSGEQVVGSPAQEVLGL